MRILLDGRCYPEAPVDWPGLDDWDRWSKDYYTVSRHFLLVPCGHFCERPRWHIKASRGKRKWCCSCSFNTLSVKSEGRKYFLSCTICEKREEIANP